MKALIGTWKRAPKLQSHLGGLGFGVTSRLQVHQQRVVQIAKERDQENTIR